MDAYRKITGQRQDSDAFRAEPGQRMDKREACCFTGHRKLPANRIAEIMERLEEEIERLIRKGVRDFLAGGALGFDTLAALTVLKLRNVYPDVRLILMLPCRDQTRYWSAHDVSVYETIRERADKVTYIAQRAHPGCMHARNRALADNSSWCVCFLVEPRGGTKYTVEYARRKGLRVINVADAREADPDAPKSDVPERDAPERDVTKRDARERDVTKRDAREHAPLKSDAPSRRAPNSEAPDRARPKATGRNATGKDATKKSATIKAAVLKSPEEVPDVCSLEFRERVETRNADKAERAPVREQRAAKDALGRGRIKTGAKQG